MNNLNVLSRMTPPLNNEYPESFKKYVELIGNEDVFKLLGSHILSVQSSISEIPEGYEDFTYSEGKWTLKEVLGHIIDTERMLSYAVLRFSRGDKTPIPGFDAKAYVSNSNPGKTTLYDLEISFGRIRDTNLSLFKSLEESQLEATGTMNGEEISVKALLYIIAGHTQHHINFIRRNYVLLFED
jgi:hypothetical protein